MINLINDEFNEIMIVVEKYWLTGFCRNKLYNNVVRMIITMQGFAIIECN